MRETSLESEKGLIGRRFLALGDVHANERPDCDRPVPDDLPDRPTGHLARCGRPSKRNITENAQIRSNSRT